MVCLVVGWTECAAPFTKQNGCQLLPVRRLGLAVNIKSLILWQKFNMPVAALRICEGSNRNKNERYGLKCCIITRWRLKLRHSQYVAAGSLLGFVLLSVIVCNWLNFQYYMDALARAFMVCWRTISVHFFPLHIHTPQKAFSCTDILTTENGRHYRMRSWALPFNFS